MESFRLLFLFLLLQAGRQTSAAPTSGPFLAGPQATALLHRQRRHNTGMLEEMLWGNVERECMEERCDLEEAREAFENDERTMEFWRGYADGDQCKSMPCQNQGICEDQLRSYTCTCLPGYAGKTCEIRTVMRCEVNNGGCEHFCMQVSSGRSECRCADSYTLARDGLTCEPEGEFSCGKDAMETHDSTRSLVTEHGNSTASHTNSGADSNSTIMAFNASLTNSTTPGGEGAGIRSASTKLPPWYLNTRLFVPNIASGGSSRIVGGNVVLPGEIPWQVALVLRSTQQVFCGGSILSERWVITAAHCLQDVKVTPYFIRVGEHNIYHTEGSEQDLEVEEQYPHPRYNAIQSLYNHDIALLLLCSPIRFSKLVRPICLGPRAFTTHLLRPGALSTVSGWGRLRFQGPASATLRSVEVPFVGRAACTDSSSSRITPYMFCAGYYDTAKDSCRGDSGGPHATRLHGTWFLTGIVSWGEECAKEGKYGVYTHVANYYLWIRYMMGISKEALVSDVEE